MKEAGYVVRLEEFEFPFFEERAPPVLVTSTPGGAQEPASAGAVRTLVNSGSSDWLRESIRKLKATIGVGVTNNIWVINFTN